MTTVFEWFTHRAELATEQAKLAVNASEANMYLAEAQNWVKRAGVLTVEDGSRFVEYVHMWQIIKECDFKLKGRVLV